MATEQLIGTLQYDRPNNVTTTPQSLASEYRLAEPTEDNQVILQQYISLDSTATAQETTITITAGSDGDIYDVAVDDGTTNDSYSYRQAGAMTAGQIAMALAKRIDLHPSVRATATDSTITVKAVVPGVNVTLDAALSTTPSNLLITTTTAAAGTPLHRKISETKINWMSDQFGSPKVNYQTTFYNGAETPVISNSGALFESKASLTLDTMQSNNGIARP